MTNFPYTLDDIAEAYTATGLTPVAHTFYFVAEGVPCGCPMTVLAVYRNGISPSKSYSAVVADALGITPLALASFIAGFDGYEINDSLTEDDDERDDPEIFALGRAARARFLPEAK